MPYIELQDQSRGYSITTDSITQTFVYRICNEDTDESDGEFGAFFAPNDDVGIAKYVYATFPFYRTFPVSTTQNVTLFLTSHSAQEQANSWTVTLTYSIPPGNESDPTYIQFGVDLGGQTEHISQSLAVRSSATRLGVNLVPPNTQGAIGITTNSITGVDILSKSMGFNVTAYYTPDFWDISILTLLYRMIGTYNMSAFYGFAPGEVLLTSISAQGDQYKLVPVTFNFSAKPNAVNLPDPPFAPLTAFGHDVIDYLYTKDINANYPIQIPLYRYVHQVYQPSNFALLGL